MNQNHSVKRSLSEVNQSVEVPHNSSFWNTLRAFLGPGALVAVGYMDP
ncbi:TPA: divalent metal cation transporter, partial [Streptococcus agalactiae]